MFIPNPTHTREFCENATLSTWFSYKAALCALWNLRKKKAFSGSDHENQNTRT